MQICCQGQRNRQNLPYALHLLSTIVTQFSDAEKELADTRKAEMQQTFVRAFPDMAYNCVLLVHLGDGEGVPTTYENQTERPTRRAGVTRIRAIELLRTLLAALGKIADVKDGSSFSALLRKKVIEASLYMMETFPFCSVANQ